MLIPWAGAELEVERVAVRRARPLARNDCVRSVVHEDIRLLRTRTPDPRVAQGTRVEGEAEQIENAGDRLEPLTTSEIEQLGLMLFAKRLESTHEQRPRVSPHGAIDVLIDQQRGTDECRTGGEGGPFAAVGMK